MKKHIFMCFVSISLEHYFKCFQIFLMHIFKTIFSVFSTIVERSKSLDIFLEFISYRTYSLINIQSFYSVHLVRILSPKILS